MKISLQDCTMIHNIHNQLSYRCNDDLSGVDEYWDGWCITVWAVDRTISKLTRVIDGIKRNSNIMRV